MENGQYVQELVNVILLPAALGIIKVPGHPKRDCLIAKGNQLADKCCPQRNQQWSNLSHGRKGYFPKLQLRKPN